MKPIVWIGAVFLIWRALLLIIAAIASAVIPVFGDKFPYRPEYLQKLYYENWFWVWGNFDGVHYLRIAQEGYSAQFSQAFFPLYPILVGFFGRLFYGDYIVSGFLISNLSFFAALVILFKMLIIDFKIDVVKKTIIFLLILPTSFYFGAVYTEGLFFLLVILSFYFARKNNFLIASIFGFLAALTRFVGIFLFPALILEYYLLHKEKITIPYVLKTSRSLYCLLLIPVGLATYMIYLAIAFDNPLYFLSAQTVFGAQRTAGEIILLPQVIWRYLKIFFNVNPLTLSFFNATFEFVSAIGFLVLVFVSFFKVRASWAIFAFLAIVIPTLTGTFSSMPRYVLIAFPVFIILAKIKSKIINAMLMVILLGLLIFTVNLFTRGYWIA